MANGNPLIAQGNINRLKASVVWTNFPQLNVTSPYLDREGITLRLEGQASMQHETMTGLVQSPEPFLAVSVVIALLKTQQLSEAYKTQMETTSLIGPGTVWPDVPQGEGLSSYSLHNMSIQSVGDLLLNGTTPIWAVTCRGFYVINSALWT
jgi:hypothetical protein